MHPKRGYILEIWSWLRRQVKSSIEKLQRTSKLLVITCFNLRRLNRLKSLCAKIKKQRFWRFQNKEKSKNRGINVSLRQRKFDVIFRSFDRKDRIRSQNIRSWVNSKWEIYMRGRKSSQNKNGHSSKFCRSVDLLSYM